MPDSDYGTVPSAVPLNLHLSLLNHFLQGAAYPVGGSSEIAFHLCRVIQEGGGAVLVRAPVQRIVLDASSSSVTGVVVDKGGGVLVSAPVVISDAGVFNTFKELLPLEPGRPLSGAAGVAAANYLKHVRHGLGGFQASRRSRRCLRCAPPRSVPFASARLSHRCLWAWTARRRSSASARRTCGRSLRRTSRRSLRRTRRSRSRRRLPLKRATSPSFSSPSSRRRCARGGPAAFPESLGTLSAQLTHAPEDP